jgi:hypothetical protein
MTIEKLNMASYSAKCLLVLENSNLGRLSNYNTWTFCISSLLQRDELIDLVEFNSNGDFKTKDKKIVNNFKHWKKKYLAFIKLSMRDEIILHIPKITNLGIMWQTLKNLFEQQSGVRHLYLNIELTNL